jgi:hypothetical protein
VGSVDDRRLPRAERNDRDQRLHRLDHPTRSPILYLFDPAGIIMFSFNGVSRFFGEKLHMADWSYQPCYDPWDKTIENIGQNYVLKYPFPGSRRWYLMYHWGTHGEMGVSYWQKDGDCFSVAGRIRRRQADRPQRRRSHGRPGAVGGAVLGPPQLADGVVAVCQHPGVQGAAQRLSGRGEAGPLVARILRSR